jgi:hypothetical protein
MKKIFITMTFCGLVLMAKSQEASVEKSTYGIQTGYFGIWAHNESRIANYIALRTEIGFDGAIWGGSFYDHTRFLFGPVITLEPRWYYSLNKREAKGKKIKGNSGNFLSLNTNYHPDWFNISNDANASVISDVSIIPTWGLKRNMGKHITFEAGFGYGYRYSFYKRAGYVRNTHGTTINLHLRFGYRF